MLRLRATVLLVGFLVVTLPLMPVQALLLRLWPSAARQLPFRYHRMLSRLLGFRVKVEGHAPREQALLVSNHVSWIDIVALSSVLPVSFVAKAEVRSWPLFGALARLQGTVFVDRGKRHQTGTARKAIEERLRGGERLVLFAEGTSHDGNSVLPFKPALLGAVTDADAGGHTQIVPVSIAYRRIRGLPMTRRQRPLFAWYGGMEMLPHLWSAVKHGPIGITIRFHAPLHPDAFESRKALARQAEAQVRDGLALTLHQG